MIKMNYDNLCINCFKDTEGYEICRYCGAVQTAKPKQLNHLYPHTILNNRYIVGKSINNGGFGVIYKAYDTRLDIIVAIKELFPTQNSMATRVPETTKVITLSGEKGELFEIQKERFLTEARTMSKLSYCESIVNVYDFFEENNTVYLVMEFLEGISLKEYLENHSEKMTFEEAMTFAKPIMEALSAVHNEKIVHRDVAPDNIFITDDKKIKLLDFGAAKFDENDIEKSVTIVAKPGYTPPEQYRSKSKIKPYTDVYAMGAMIYHMVTGVLPEESIDRVENDELKRPSKLGVNMPLYAEKSLMKALALNENARFKTMNDFLLALEGKKKADYPEIELKRKRIIRTVSFVAVFAVIIASVFGGMSYRKSVSFVPDDCELTVWLPQSDKDDQAMWNDIMTDYFAQFCAEQDQPPKVSVKITYVKDSDYSKKFISAYSKSKQPDIFRADLVKDSDKYSADLSKLMSEIDEGDMTTQFSVFKNNISSNKKFALRFDSLLMYTNISLVPESNLTSWDKSNLYDGKKGGADVLAIGTDSVIDFSKQCGYKSSSDTSVFDKVLSYSNYKNSKNKPVDPLQLFGKGTIGYYIGYASDRLEIENYIGSDSLHAYKVSTISGYDKCYSIFPEMFSISADSSSNKKQASMFLLYFTATNETVQSILKSSEKGYLPILKSTSEEFKDEAHGLYTTYKNADENSFLSYDDAYTYSITQSNVSSYVDNGKDIEKSKKKILSQID